jgi:hypothetical protein
VLTKNQSPQRAVIVRASPDPDGSQEVSTSVNGSLETNATPLYDFCPRNTTRHPGVLKIRPGKLVVHHFGFLKANTSGRSAANHFKIMGNRDRTELALNVAIFMG